MNVDHGATALFGVAGSAVSLLAPIPYGLAILRRAVRPHLFTWLIWSVVTAIAATGQFVGNAGPSAWCTVAIAITCFLTFAASIFRGERGRSRLDWFFLGAAIAAVPLWALTDDPTLSVCLVTLVEVAGLGPTLCKTIRAPWSESLSYFALCVLKYVLATLALRNWTLATALYPTANVVVCIAFCTLIVVRRGLLLNSRTGPRS